jgi:DNA polymerase
LLGASEARVEAERLAAQAATLEELSATIADFDGIALKKTATNMVFADGNPKAPVMLIGEAPGADEDRLGKPFVGVSGQLLDKILAAAGLDRQAEEPEKAVYISNILNWRPPGNRTPSPAEIEVSLPFIERHIQLVKPRILILCGSVSAKALLSSEESVSRLRKIGWHDYCPRDRGNTQTHKKPDVIPAIVTYHPSYLLRTPAQKKAVWADMIALIQKREALGLK